MPSHEPNASGRLFAPLVSTEEAERARAFTVHNNYVGGIASHLRHEYGPDEATLLIEMVATQRKLPAFNNIRGSLIPDNRSLRRYLSIAWASELQLRQSGMNDASLLRYSNAWAPVHSYYAVYMSLQAWFAVNGTELVDDHTRSLRAISSTIDARPLLPSPFDALCGGCPQTGSTTYRGFPEGIDHVVEVLSRPSEGTFWPRFATLLRTTREARLERNFTEWKRAHGRQRMRDNEKLAVASTLKPTTIFDFLWRMRIRSNYRDVSTFLVWSVADDSHSMYHDGMVVLTSTLATLLDALVARKVGREAYVRILDEFLEQARRGGTPDDAMSFLRLRRAVIAGR